MRNTDENSRQLLALPVVALNIAVLIGGAAAVVFVSQHNAEFQTTLRLWKYVEEENWGGILQDKYADDVPNLLIIQIRNLALFKLNRHTDQMFTYPQVSKKVPSLETFADKLDCEDRIVYEYGEINAANMIAMRMMSPSMKNYKPHTVITLALCAMQNDEIGLARKYLMLLSHSPLHKRWAKDRLQYINDKALLDASLANSIDEHLAAVHSIMPKDMRAAFIPNVPFGSLYIQSILNRDYASSPESIRQLRLMILLHMNRPQEFLRDFEIWHKNRPNVTEKLPVHFQEAILILAQYPLRTVPQHEFSPDILARYQKLVAFINSRSRTDTSALREQFGDTYWYYALLRQNNPQRQ
ncbi:hypothetical protein FACS1894170_01280 [Planctomycetales bacterium]|nr:hypothetical protein FACS1894170_01280 [Planctomycetales bacterium]